MNFRYISQKLSNITYIYIAYATDVAIHGPWTDIANTTYDRVLGLFAMLVPGGTAIYGPYRGGYCHIWAI